MQDGHMVAGYVNLQQAIHAMVWMGAGISFPHTAVSHG